MTDLEREHPLRILSFDALATKAERMERAINTVASQIRAWADHMHWRGDIGIAHLMRIRAAELLREVEGR